MLDFSQFTFNADGTISGLSNNTGFGEQIALINTPTSFPLGLFGQDVANALTTAASNGATIPVVTTAQTNRLLLGVGVAVAFGAGFFLLKNKG